MNRRDHRERCPACGRRGVPDGALVPVATPKGGRSFVVCARCNARLKHPEARELVIAALEAAAEKNGGGGSSQ
jgi:hypothetical protein